MLVRVSRKPIFFGMPSTVVLSERNPCAGLGNPSLHRTRKSGAPVTSTLAVMPLDWRTKRVKCKPLPHYLDSFSRKSPMVLIRAFFVLSTAVLLFGCASQSKTADQLRDNVQRNATFTSREVFEVKKPYRQVSDTLRKKWLECLDSTTTGSFHRGGNTFGTLTNIYKPKVAVTDRRTEL